MSNLRKCLTAGAATGALVLFLSAAHAQVRRITPALNPGLITPTGSSFFIPTLTTGFGPTQAQLGVPAVFRGGQRVQFAGPTIADPFGANSFLVAPQLQNPLLSGFNVNPLISNPTLSNNVTQGLAAAGVNSAFAAANPFGFGNPFLGNAALSTNPFLTGGLGTGGLGTGGLGTAALTSTGVLPTNAGFGGAYGSELSNPYSGLGGYGGYGQLPDPNAGYMHGAADVINAQGRFRLSTAQSNLLNQQIEREKIENRRRWVDQYLYEREHLPTTEDDRERTQRITLQRSLNDPPVNEILSATALNTLLANLEKLQGDKSAAGANVPVDEDVLRRINVTSPQGGNIGLLRTGGKLNWPIALRSADFQRDREKIESLVPDAISLAKDGKSDPAALAELNNSIERMRQQLSADLRDLTPDQGIEARRYLNNLGSAIKALERPDAGALLNRDWAARGSTVADLVKNMKDRGLVFAPSVGGDEAAYLALQRALATYNASLSNAQVSTANDKEKPAP
jgi:hypothetical protein